MIKLISGYSNPGGSTVAHINLVNLFNKNGLDATFYGPHPWHLDKCKAKPLNEFVLAPGDNLIVHYIGLEKREPIARKIILSCHETNVYPVKRVAPFWDKIHFVSKYQQEWQEVDKDYKIIPNVISPLKRTRIISSPIDSVVGVIGSIDSHKQPHISIDRALAHGWSKVKLFGDMTDIDYFKAFVFPRLNANVVYCGFVNNKNDMYNAIDCVFHSSLRETFNYVMHECEKLKIPYYGTEACDPKSELWDDKKILEAWKELLEL